MKRYQESFPGLLQGIAFDTIEKQSSPVYALSSDWRLIYVNPAWVTYASENADSTFATNFKLGTDLNDFSSTPDHEPYFKKYQEVVETGEPWHRDFDCSSPSKYRTFRQSVYPLKKQSGVLLVNKLRVELHFDQKAEPKLEQALYLLDNGTITQCSNCKCVQRADKPEYWEWVGKWVREIPRNASHSICPICLDYYWKSPLGLVDCPAR